MHIEVDVTEVDGMVAAVATILATATAAVAARYVYDKDITHYLDKADKVLDQIEKWLLKEQKRRVSKGESLLDMSASAKMEGVPGLGELERAAAG